MKKMSLYLLCCVLGTLLCLFIACSGDDDDDNSGQPTGNTDETIPGTGSSSGGDSSAPSGATIDSGSNSDKNSSDTASTVPTGSGSDTETSAGADTDGDGIVDGIDNCPTIANPDQANNDLRDSYGDVCDNCPKDGNDSQLDSDGDKIGDICDNCPNNANPDQKDGDMDKVGDACDTTDNCPDAVNPGEGIDLNNKNFEYTATILTEDVPFNVDAFMLVINGYIQKSLKLTPEQKEQISTALDAIATVLKNPTFAGPQDYTQSGNTISTSWFVESFGGVPLDEKVKIFGDGFGCFQTSTKFELMPTELTASMTDLITIYLIKATALIIDQYVTDSKEAEQMKKELEILINSSEVQNKLTKVFGDVTIDNITIAGPISITKEGKITPTLKLTSEELLMVITPGEGSETQPNQIKMTYETTSTKN